jgi:hypothetical protein
MFDSIAIDVSAFVGAVYLLSPLAVRWTYRFSARCQPRQASLESLPEQVAALFRKRIPEIHALGFELLGCFDCGSLTSDTHSFVAYFVNRRTNDFANVSVLLSPNGAASYLEFSTSFTNGVVLETNTNRVLPLTPAGAATLVFRFPDMPDAQQLFQAHRQLIEKYAGDLRTQGEPRGQEIQRFVRVIENYGPRHCRIGYMQLAEDRHSYKLTWKGAFLMTWCGLWPVSFIRKWMHRHAMHSELHALETEQVVLQKA